MTQYVWTPCRHPEGLGVVTWGYAIKAFGNQDFRKFRKS
jgi:hypothetical protein